MRHFECIIGSYSAAFLSNLYPTLRWHAPFLCRSAQLCPFCSPFCCHRPVRDLFRKPCRPELAPPSCRRRSSPFPSHAPSPVRGVPATPDLSGSPPCSLWSPSGPCCLGCPGNLGLAPFRAHGHPVARGPLWIPDRLWRREPRSRSRGRRAPSLVCCVPLFKDGTKSFKSIQEYK